MRVVISGTPGVGKSSVSKELAKRINAVHLNLNQLIKEKSLHEGTDKKLKTRLVGIDKLSGYLSRYLEKFDKDVIIDSHLAHLLPEELVDVVFVLRTDPMVLKERLKKEGFAEEKIKENLEAEAIDVCLVEALEKHEKVHEIDTTNKAPERIATEILDCLEGKRELKPGKIDWSEYLLK